MLTGKRAFEGDDIADTLGAIIHKTPDWNQLPSATPAWTRQLVVRCLEKDPRRRLRDIGEARVFLEQPAVADGPAAATADAQRATPVRARAWAGATIAALVASALTAAIVLSMRRSAPAADRLVQLAMPLLAGESVEPFRGLAISPDGQAVAFLSRLDRAEPKLVIRRFDGQVTVAFDGSGAASYPFFSPDGQWLAFFADNALKKVP